MLAGRSVHLFRWIVVLIGKTENVPPLYIFFFLSAFGKWENIIWFFQNIEIVHSLDRNLNFFFLRLLLETFAFYIHLSLKPNWSFYIHSSTKKVVFYQCVKDEKLMRLLFVLFLILLFDLDQGYDSKHWTSVLYFFDANKAWQNSSTYGVWYFSSSLLQYCGLQSALTNNATFVLYVDLQLEELRNVTVQWLDFDDALCKITWVTSTCELTAWVGNCNICLFVPPPPPFINSNLA